MLEHYLETHDHQFRFKCQHATDMCIFTVKSVITYYTKQNSTVFTCFLNATKAFDRVSHWTLFSKMIKKKHLYGWLLLELLHFVINLNPCVLNGVKLNLIILIFVKSAKWFLVYLNILTGSIAITDSIFNFGNFLTKKR